MTTYHATVERDGRFWFVQVDGVGVTQARHLRELDSMTRDLIACAVEVDADAVEVDYDLRLPASVDAHLEEARRLRAESAEARSAAAEEVRAAARLLSEAGLTVRDIGQALGVSYQRVHQLLHA